MVFIAYLPLLASIAFAILSMIAFKKYPGGHHLDPNHPGFSWRHNYMCDITDTMATNGQVNPAARLATLANIILILGIATFLFSIPDWLSVSSTWSMILKWLGTISMIAAALIFSRYHDLMIGLASVTAILPFVGIFIAFSSNQEWALFYWGVACLVIIVLNNIMFYTKAWVHWLPLMQKISYLQVMIWLSWATLKFS